MSASNSVPFIHPSAIVDEGASIGPNTKVWHFSHIMGTARIGHGCILGQNVFVGPKVVLGNGVKVQNNVSLYEGVVCEDDVFLGPSCVFTNVVNPRSFIERKEQFKKTLIRKGASIGANATILCGNRIGQYALIGAGAVVTKPVPDYALVLGNPAKQVGWVSRLGHRLHFNQLGLAFCPEGKDRYQLTGNKVIHLDPLTL
jgi:UDP-2-acetamido-3-amino-2,3-dideoxy-glucuronate N-acetyltransferase